MLKSNFALRLQVGSRRSSEAGRMKAWRSTSSSTQRSQRYSQRFTEDYFSQRAGRANLPKALKILKRAGAGNPPMKGDEMAVKRRRR